MSHTFNVGSYLDKIILLRRAVQPSYIRTCSIVLVILELI